MLRAEVLPGAPPTLWIRRRRMEKRTLGTLWSLWAQKYCEEAKAKKDRNQECSLDWECCCRLREILKLRDQDERYADT
jgi:hypothetical protein